MEILANYNFEIKYQPGEENMIADALSRKLQEDTQLKLAIEISNNMATNIKKELKSDQKAREIIEHLQDSKARLPDDIQNQGKYIIFQEDNLYYDQRLYIPAS